MGTVSKALELLGYFTQQRTHIGLSEFARISGMNKATVYRMLTELQAAGIIEQTGADKNYRLGTEVLRLAKLREAAVPMLNIVRPILRRLCADTGETSHFSLIQGGALVSVAHAYSSTHATQVMMDDAESLPYHSTSSGMSALAYSDPAIVDDVLSSPLQRYTENTITDPDVIRAQLIDVRAKGYYHHIGSFEEDVISCAAPIFDAEGKPLGAVAVAAPSNRVTDITPIAQHVVAAAAEITLGTGGAHPSSYPIAAE